MSNRPSSPSRILIVGAGAMGLVTGYHLALGGSAVTYLVRPHRLADLHRSQILYSYDDGGLKRLDGFAVIADVAEIRSGAFDFIVLTLDGAALGAPEGLALVEAIGHIVRGSSTTIVIGSIGIARKSWLLERTSLPPEQIIGAALSILAHPVSGVRLPLHPPTDEMILNQADLAFGHTADHGFVVEASAPEAAGRFAAVYDACGVSRCAVSSTAAFESHVLGLFPVFAACDLMGWPEARRLGERADLWAVTTKAVREVQALPTHGTIGRDVAAATTEDTLIAEWSAMEAAALPLDLQAFNRFHHGGKVRVQDRLLLEDCVAAGEAHGHPMPALRTLLSWPSA